MRHRDTDETPCFWDNIYKSCFRCMVSCLCGLFFCVGSYKWETIHETPCLICKLKTTLTGLVPKHSARCILTESRLKPQLSKSKLQLSKSKLQLSKSKLQLSKNKPRVSSAMSSTATSRVQVSVCIRARVRVLPMSWDVFVEFFPRIRHCTGIRMGKWVVYSCWCDCSYLGHECVHVN